MNAVDYKRIEKIVRVSDPENWYCEDTVTVALLVTPEYKGYVTVRIVVYSIDDFMVTYDHECCVKYGEAIKSAYDHIKRWMYDTMPDEIDLDWLYEHGYFPF